MATTNALIGIAGVHYVVAELSRRGLVALPTVRNTAAYDILVANQQGTRHANVQVKASYRRVSFFPMPAPERLRTGRHDVYVLLRWLEREDRYECFLLTGRQAHNAVAESIEKQMRGVKAGTRKRSSVWPVVEISAEPARAERWHRAWVDWTL